MVNFKKDIIGFRQLLICKKCSNCCCCTAIILPFNPFNFLLLFLVYFLFLPTPALPPSFAHFLAKFSGNILSMKRNTIKI